MKKVMASIIFFVFSITLVWAQNGSVVIQTAKPSTDVTLHTWVLVITPQTTKHYLDSVSAAWKKDSISLKFSKLQYKKGKLVIVSGSVNFISKNKPISGTFPQDSVYLAPLQIKLTDTPSIIIRKLINN